MGRILFFVLLGIAAYVAYRWWRVSQRIEQRRTEAAANARSEAMVRCDVCGLNVPQSEALAAGERWYCSEGHRRRGAGG
jgi:predicted negative regulator of RcsB-dependent stress response